MDTTRRDVAQSEPVFTRTRDRLGTVEPNRGTRELENRTENDCREFCQNSKRTKQNSGSILVSSGGDHTCHQKLNRTSKPEPQCE